MVGFWQASTSEGIDMGLGGFGLEPSCVVAVCTRTLYNR